MKKLLFTLSILLNLALLSAADFQDQRNAKSVLKKTSACGYTIVEFGKGVDCHGDTIMLKKINGLQVRASL